MQTKSSALPVRAAERTRLVVDAPMRMFHWLFALCFAGAYLAAESERWRLLHISLGYTMVGLLVFRVFYGVVGPPQARLSLVLKRARGVWAWTATLLGAAPATPATPINWRLGQNLLMGLAVLLLLTLLVPVALSGYAANSDWSNWLGGDWISELHEFFGEMYLYLVFAHLGLIALLSWLRRKNQARAMLTGRIEGLGPDLVRKNRVGLALVLFLLTLAGLTWQLLA